MKAIGTMDIGSRDSVLLENDTFRTVINREKGMVPELSSRSGGRWINAHWQPWFRGNSGRTWNPADHEPFWKVPLLFDIAGTFPCCPNFGPDHQAEGYDLPPHGFCCSRTWHPVSLESSETHAAAVWEQPAGEHPFRYRKTDLIRRGENVHYTRLEITNTGEEPEKYNCGWHNTVGAPFLESGCIISNNAERFAVPPEGSEFDPTGRLAFGAECDTMKAVPLRSGGTIDLSVVPGVSGYTDFLTAAVPQESRLGWSSIVNPRQKMVYLSWFPGPAALQEDGIPLYFYDYWMNYGGREYQPWAAADGGTDRSFCLGAENATGYFANGLGEAVDHPELLGNPTFLILPPGETRTLCYATAFFPYEGDGPDRGIREIEAGEGALILKDTRGGSLKVRAQTGFDRLKEPEA